MYYPVFSSRSSMRCLFSIKYGFLILRESTVAIVFSALLKKSEESKKRRNIGKLAVRIAEIFATKTTAAKHHEVEPSKGYHTERIRPTSTQGRATF